MDISAKHHGHHGHHGNHGHPPLLSATDVVITYIGYRHQFGGPEGFQGVPGARGYVLTKFGLKRTHLTLVHTRFHDFLPILGALGPGPWALVDTSCRSQLDMDLDISDLGFDRISIHKMGGYWDWFPDPE